MEVVCRAELKERRRAATLKDKGISAAQRRAMDSGINSKVDHDIQTVFKGKTSAQLALLNKQIKERIKSGTVDVGYWETLLEQMDGHLARGRLRELHQATLQRKLALLKQSSAAENVELVSYAANSDDEVVFDENDLKAIEEEDDDDAEDDGVGEAPDLPLLYPGDPEYDAPTRQAEAGEAVVAERTMSVALEQALLLANRRKVLFNEPVPEALIRAAGATVSRVEPDTQDTAGDAFMAAQAEQDMGADEVVFNDVVKESSRVYAWRDKYKPRKPRFFNRVHTGFEWNKYNQTHYDSDTPPPKVVQGYKFNIFYPDLVDKSTVPDYSITPCRDEPGFAFLKFSAGAPYEDIAFKIVDRPWEMAHRRGFRCQFSHHVLQLWFHFVRERYRR